MKVKIKVEQEMEISSIRIVVPVRFGEEQLPNDFPMRIGDQWKVEIDMDSGRITGWPAGREAHVYLKVCDEGEYTLIGKSGECVARRQCYVPMDTIPGEYGDYLDFHVRGDGVVTNWPKHPDVSEFFSEEIGQ